MRRISWILIGSWLLSAPAHAQTQTVIVGQAFSATFTHTGTNTSGYRLYLDNVKIADVSLNQLQAGTVSVPVSGGVSARGPHALVASAYNADAETKSAPLNFTAVLPNPDPPSQPSIVITIALNQDGSISAHWKAQ